MLLYYASISFVCSGFFIMSLIVGGDDTDAADLDGDEFRILSFKSLMFFGMGFGVAGAFSAYAGLGTFWTGTLASLSGAMFVVLGLVLLRAVYSQQASTNFNTSELVGRFGEVVVRIGNNAPGQIVANDSHGRNVYCTAYSKTPIPPHTRVKIIAVTGSSVEVEGV